MNPSLKNKLRKLFYPVVLIKRELYYQWLRYLGIHNPKKLASILHYDYCKREIDWDNPKDLNEKINWLKFNSDTSMWSQLSDKYAVRKHLEDAGLGDMLVELYGVWSSVEDIDFVKLPQSFVFKSTNGSGTVMVVPDKSKLDLIEVKEMLNKWLKESFGIMTAEPHYFAIKPRIIAEELLINDKNDFSTSIVDYKIWCFSGEPYTVFTCYNRKVGKEIYITSHDLDWNFHPENLKYGDHYRKSENGIPCPKSLNKMIDACKLLAKPFPQVRIDFYEVNGKPYFGEMTFTSLGGNMDYFSEAYLLEMGSKINLDKK